MKQNANLVAVGVVALGDVDDADVGRHRRREQLRGAVRILRRGRACAQVAMEPLAIFVLLTCVKIDIRGFC